MSDFRVGDKLLVTTGAEFFDAVKAGTVLEVVEDLGIEWINNTHIDIGWISHGESVGYVFQKLETVQPVVGNPKYNREIKPGVFVDVYDVLYAFKVTDPCLQHLIKKALAAGQRGHKDARQDLVDIRDSAQRALDSYDLWSHSA